MKTYKNYLKQQKIKKNILETFLGPNYKAILSQIIILFTYLGVFTGVTIYFNKVKELSLLYSMYKSICYSIIISVVLFISIGLIVVITEFLVVKVPVIWNSRYLPLTQEEFDKLPYKTDEEFYQFLEYCCSKKFFKQRTYVFQVYPDIEKLLSMYNKSKGIKDIDKIYLWENCNEEFKRYIIKAQHEHGARERY